LGQASNLIFEESSSILGQGGNVITFGQSGDKFDFSVTDVDYWFETIESVSTDLWIYASSSSESVVVIENPDDNKPVRLFIEGAITVASSTDTLTPTVYNYNNFGGGTPGQGAIATSGDVYIRGDFEVDGVAYLSGGTAWTQGDFAENIPVRALTLDEIFSNQEINLNNTSTASSTHDIQNDIDFTTLPEEGDVLVLDEQEEWTAVKSSTTNSNKILGVVSTDPAGILRGDLQRAGKEVRPLSLTGTIPVKVSLENGPIEKGDLLTTSSRPGYAMKANSKSAGILGIALENYTEDKEENINENNLTTSTVVDLVENSLGEKEADRKERLEQENNNLDVDEEVVPFETPETKEIKAGGKILVLLSIDNKVSVESELQISVVENLNQIENVNVESYEFLGQIAVQDLIVSGDVIVVGTAEFLSEAKFKSGLNLTGAIVKEYLEKENEELKIGDAIYISGENTVARAYSDLIDENGLFKPAIGMVVDVIENDFEENTTTQENLLNRKIKVAFSGSVSGFKNLVPGATYYLNSLINELEYKIENSKNATSSEELIEIISLTLNPTTQLDNYIQALAVAESESSLLIMPSLSYQKYTESLELPEVNYEQIIIVDNSSNTPVDEEEQENDENLDDSEDVEETENESVETDEENTEDSSNVEDAEAVENNESTESTENSESDESQEQEIVESTENSESDETEFVEPENPELEVVVIENIEETVEEVVEEIQE